MTAQHVLHDIDLLLWVGIAVMAFVAFEVAALQLRRFHTISWYAAHHLVLRVAIFLLFAAGPLWWIHHLMRGIGW